MKNQAVKVTYQSQFKKPVDLADLFFDIDDIDINKIEESFREHGVVAITTKEKNKKAQDAFDALYENKKSSREIDRFNGVNFCTDQELDPAILAIESDKSILDVVSRLLHDGGAQKHVQPSILNSKLLVKDARFSGEVFLHQDSCYQFGGRKVTVFFPLCDLTDPELNATTIKILLGTHKFGHLGDAGEINREVLEENWPEFEMKVREHTYVLMDPSSWHYSNSSALKNKPRSIYTFTYVENSALSKRLPGCRDDINRNAFTEGEVFIRSRVSRLKELQKTVDAANEKSIG